MELSLVIPVYNERESLEELWQEIRDVADRHGYQIQAIFVDDGSEDGSWEVIAGLAAADRRVEGIRLRRNFGKAAALSAGFAHARAPLIITMDADLQDDPNEIPRFLEKLEEGFDVVSGWKRIRHDPWHKVWPSRVFNWLVSTLTGVRLHDHNCGFKCYRREIFDEVHLYGELHRFVPVLAAARGWRVGEIEVHHRPRPYGQSKYGMWRIVHGLLDLLTVYFLTGFGQRPQHLLGAIGLLGFLAGSLGLMALTILWFVSRWVAGMEPVHLHQRAVFYYSVTAILLGAQLMAIGFLAELITAHLSQNSRPYSIREHVRASPRLESQQAPSSASPESCPDPSSSP